MYEFDKLCFEGGGIFGIAYIGALKYLEEQDLLRNVNAYSGTSSGSIIALMLALGYTNSEMYAFMESVKWDKLYDYNIGCFSFFPGYGLYKGNRLTKLYKDMIKKKTGSSYTTFKELYERTGKKLYVCAVNATQQTTVYFNVDSHPHMELHMALRFSTSYPLVFKSLKYNGDYYVDGGVMDNYPIEAFECDKNVLGLKLLTNPKEDKKIDGMLDFTKHLFGAMMEGQEMAESYPYVEKTVFIEMRSESLLTSVLDIGNSKNEFQFYHDTGYKAMQDFCEDYPRSVQHQMTVAHIEPDIHEATSLPVEAVVSEQEPLEEVVDEEEYNNDVLHLEE